MGKFNSYGKKINEIAAAAFEDYRKAEAAYKKAEEQRNKYPQRMGMVDAEYAAKSARAQADFLEAKEAFTKAKNGLQSHNAEIAALRKQLVAELDDHYAADPAKLDGGTLELLKSGILKPNEYAKLMNEASASGNHTMARMIAKYAENAAADVGKRYGENSEQARELRAIGYAANRNNGSDTLGAFDVMAEVYSRTSNNPAMMSAWGELTDAAAESL